MVNLLTWVGNKLCSHSDAEKRSSSRKTDKKFAYSAHSAIDGLRYEKNEQAPKTRQLSVGYCSSCKQKEKKSKSTKRLLNGSLKVSWMDLFLPGITQYLDLKRELKDLDTEPSSSSFSP